jgi:hypothetical protein
MLAWPENSSVYSVVIFFLRRSLCLLTALPVLAVAGEQATGVRPAVAVNKVAPAAAKARLVESYGKLPLGFEANQGQTNPRVQFLSRGRGYGLFLTPNEAVLSLQGGKAEVKGQKAKGKSENLGIAGLRSPNPESGTPAILRLKLVGAEANPRIEGLEELPGKSNYFIGNDSKQWRTGVSNYRKVRYESVYRGVDLVYYGNQGQLEYDWIVAPGADPKTIKFAIEGAEKVGIDPAGDLVLVMEGGEVRFHKPVVYQEPSAVGRRPSAEAGHHQSTIDNRQFLDGRYVLRTAKIEDRNSKFGNPKSKIENPKYEVAFEVGPYDESRPLVIDPVLSYSTFLGGGDTDVAVPIRVLDDGFGGAYAFVAGRTASANFPTTAGAYDETCGTDGACDPTITVSTLVPTPDAFIAKLSADGTSLVYSTFLGGSGPDEVDALAVDSAGNVYVTGATLSLADFPVTGGAYTTVDGTLFVAKLNAAGSALVYSSRFGGTNFEQATSIAIDTSGNAYAGGYTYSTDFPTTVGAFQETYPGGTCGISFTFDCPHGYVARLSVDGSTLDYSTYLGGGQADYVFGTAVDGSGNAYLVGVTQSTDFPNTSDTTGAYQGTFGGETTSCDAATTFCGDAFITKLDPTLSGPPVFSTFLGGSGNDVPGLGSVALDGSGNVFVAGHTDSANFPVTSGAYQTALVSLDDAFVAEIDSTGTALSYSTFLGGSGTDVAESLARDGNGNIYISGYTDSTDFPTASPLQGSCASCGSELPDAFVAKFNPTLSGLIFSDYLGGAGSEDAFGIAVDGAGRAYVTGSTTSSDFPITLGAYQGTSGGGNDAFIAKFSGLALPVVALDTTNLSSPWFVNVGASDFRTITISNLGDAPLTFTLFNNPADPLTGYSGNGDFTWNDSFDFPCGSSLAAGTSCVRNVIFAPTAAGDRGGVLAVTDNDRNVPGTTQTVTVTGVGTEPIISAAPGSLDFGAVPVGNDSAAFSVHISNSGTGDSAVAVVVTPPFVQTVPPLVAACSLGLFALSPDTGCDLYMIFHPTAPGLATGTLTITSEDPVNPVAIVDLSGVGAGNPVPLINQPLVPAAVAPGGPLPSLTVNGTGFVSGASVLWNGSALTTAFVNGSQLTATVPGANIASASTASITVENPGPGGGASNVVFFHVRNSASSASFTRTVVSSGAIPLSTQTVASADFNNDGKLDLVSTNQSGSFSIILGNGNGTFQSAAVTSVTTPRGITARDLNGDGIADLAIAHGNSPGYVAVALGNGDGTFQALVDYATDAGPQYVMAADLNGDGVVDLAVPTFGGNISILLGHGDGTFGAAANYAGGGDSLAIGDFNGDGKLDLASTPAGSTTTVNVLLGNGDGSFQAAVPYTAGATSRSVVAADFDGDGKLDLAVANLLGDTISFLKGNGDGTFQSKVDYATSAGPTYLVTGDFNGDNKLDLAVTTYYGGLGVSVLLGNGDGTFQAKTDSLAGAYGLTTGDFDGDGKLDLASTGALDNNISVLLQAAVPVAQLSASSLSFAARLVGTTSGTQSVTLTNIGSANLVISTVVLGGANPGDFTKGGNCAGATLTPGQPCTVSATFKPTALGGRTAKITVTDNSNNVVGATQIISLSGTGTGSPAITLSPSTGVSFTGNPLNLTCPTKPVTLTNTGDIPLTISSIDALTLLGTGVFTTTSDCPTSTSLAPGASCTINVRFSPTEVGPSTGTLIVGLDPPPTGLNSVSLSGNGTPACALTASAKTVKLLRGTDVTDVTVSDRKPSCSPLPLELTCSLENPAACALYPAQIPPSGSSTLRISNLKAVAADRIRAVVNARSEFRVSAEAVDVLFADYAFTTAPDSAAVRAGESASYSLAIRPINGLSGDLSLACSGAPKGATCSVSPATLTLDGSSLATARVKVTTAGRSLTSPPVGNPESGPGVFGRIGWPWLGTLGMAVLLAMFNLRRRRAGLVLAAAMLLVLFWAACGGGGFNSNFNSGGTTSGTYTLTVTGTYTASPAEGSAVLVHDVKLTLKVN